MPELTPGSKGGKYPRAICLYCHAEIPLNKDGRLRIHRDHSNAFYGVPNYGVPICIGSRSRNHDQIRRDQ